MNEERPSFVERDMPDGMIPLGRAQKLARLLADNPSATVAGLEATEKGDNFDIVIDLGHNHKQDPVLRTDTTMLLAARGWAAMRAQGQLPQFDKLQERAGALLSVPIGPVGLIRNPGEAEAGVRQKYAAYARTGPAMGMGGQR